MPNCPVSPAERPQRIATLRIPGLATRFALFPRVVLPRLLAFIQPPHAFAQGFHRLCLTVQRAGQIAALQRPFSIAHGALRLIERPARPIFVATPTRQGIALLCQPLAQSALTLGKATRVLLRPALCAFLTRHRLILALYALIIRLAFRLVEFIELILQIGKRVVVELLLVAQHILHALGARLTLTLPLALPPGDPHVLQ